MRTSLLSWERGLKSDRHVLLKASGFVAPLVGAWIEISDAGVLLALVPVAPLVGAWIEIVMDQCPERCLWSLLSWERGLKCHESSDTGPLPLSLLSWERGLKFCQTF